MRVLVQNTLTHRQWIGFDGPAGFIIGRDDNCDIKLDSRFVSGIHARIDRSDSGWEVELPSGVNPVELDGKPVEPGQRVPLRGGAGRLRIMEFVLTLTDAQRESMERVGIDQQLTEVQNALHAAVLRRLDLRLGSWSHLDASSERADQLNRIVDDLLMADFRTQVFSSELSPLIIKRALRGRLSDWVYRRLTKESRAAARWSELGTSAEMEATLGAVISKLAVRIGFAETKALPASAEDVVDAHFDTAVEPIAAELLENVKTYLAAAYLKKTLYDMIFGLGPLEDLLRSPSITEIMVVGPNQIYIERHGRISRVPTTFPSEEAAMTIIERIVAPLGRRIDRSQPLVDARLRDGSRVNAIIEPLSLKGPCITIRKFPVFKVSVEDLMRWGSITPAAVALVRACVLAKCNILISGGTGSGKTTLLNVLSSFIPPVERLVTVEDSAELRLQQEHVVPLETKPANAEGVGQYTARDLVRNALRMRPDRIIVGEVRGNEAVDMLQAMNTGHRGSMTTVHSNSAFDAISRLETMVLMAAEIPLPAVRRQIAQALHLIVHVERLGSGQRMVSQISEVIGLHPTSGEVEIRDIMQLGYGPQDQPLLRPTGYMPSFLGEMVDKGYLQMKSWFDQVKT
jgi:pilus assembly protein CpaF